MNAKYNMQFAQWLEDTELLQSLRQHIANMGKNASFLSDDFLLPYIQIIQNNPGKEKSIVRQLAQSCPPIQQSCGPDGCW